MGFPFFASLTSRRAISGAFPEGAGPSPPNTRVPKVVGPGAGAYGPAREMAALLVWTAAIFLALALASYIGDPSAAPAGLPGWPGFSGADGAAMPPGQPTSVPAMIGANWVGPVGETCARAIVNLIGVIAWAIPCELALLGIPLIRGQRSEATPTRLAGDILIIVVIAAMIQVGWPTHVAFGLHPAGGEVGLVFGELARTLFSTIGSFLVGFACLGLVLIGRASFSFIALVRLVALVGTKVASGVASAVRHVASAWHAARELERSSRDAQRQKNLPRIELTPAVAGVAFRREGAANDGTFSKVGGRAQALASPMPFGLGDAVADVLSDDGPLTPLPPKRKPRKRKGGPEALASPTTPSDGSSTESNSATDVEAAPVVASSATLAPPTGTPSPAFDEHAAPSATGTDNDEDEDEDPAEEPDDRAGRSVPPANSTAPAKARPAKEPPLPTIVDTSAALAREVERPALRPEKPRPRRGEGAAGPVPYRLPPIDFLVPAKVDPALSIDKELLFRNADLLVKTLADYGVQGKVEDILPGPTVTTYEVSPAAGTKVSKVASLADDLALALAKKVRIVAPIPGKNRIGFELPNDRRIAVNLRDLCEDRRFEAFEANLPVVLGRDIVGNPVYADLASMPHVIVAGATGAGKSVGLNVMLTSLLYRRSPEELRLLMIDPKVVELAPFDRIPHMLLPVVTDMKQAATALKWAVNEMERRYQLFADAGTKNIGTYNAWAARVASGQTKNPLPRTVTAKDHNGFSEEIRPGDGEAGVQPLPERMAFIVIVVDEFADLMMQQGKEVEACVARLAQKARAAGMHVILATQRPSVDVITGMIKANFPTRIAFRVAQKVDSRTILDEQGAEHLLGNGDMLIKLNGTNETKRVQCPWVSEGEVQQVTDFLRAQGEPVYDDNILKPIDEDGDAPAEDEGEADLMYDDAVRVVSETRRCSTSWLQRKLGLGYNRAARIVETMERRGLVGPANGAKDREVLIDSI